MSHNRKRKRKARLRRRRNERIMRWLEPMMAHALWSRLGYGSFLGSYTLPGRVQHVVLEGFVSF